MEGTTPVILKVAYLYHCTFFKLCSAHDQGRCCYGFKSSFACDITERNERKGKAALVQGE